MRKIRDFDIEFVNKHTSSGIKALSLVFNFIFRGFLAFLVLYITDIDNLRDPVRAYKFYVLYNIVLFVDYMYKRNCGNVLKTIVAMLPAGIMIYIYEPLVLIQYIITSFLLLVILFIRPIPEEASRLTETLLVGLWLRLLYIFGK